MRTTRLVGMLVVLTLLGGAVRPAYAHRDKDTIIYVGVGGFAVALLVTLLVAGVFHKQITADASDPNAQMAMTAPDAAQRAEPQGGRYAVPQRREEHSGRARDAADRSAPGTTRFGLLCAQGPTSFTVACW